MLVHSNTLVSKSYNLFTQFCGFGTSRLSKVVSYAMVSDSEGLRKILSAAIFITSKDTSNLHVIHITSFFVMLCCLLLNQEFS